MTTVKKLNTTLVGQGTFEMVISIKRMVYVFIIYNIFLKIYDKQPYLLNINKNSHIVVSCVKLFVQDARIMPTVNVNKSFFCILNIISREFYVYYNLSIIMLPIKVSLVLSSLITFFLYPILYKKFLYFTIYKKILRFLTEVNESLFSCVLPS